MVQSIRLLALILALLVSHSASAQQPQASESPGAESVGEGPSERPAPRVRRRRFDPPAGPLPLADVRLRDVCILADKESQTYYMIGSRGPRVWQYTSRDLRTWDGPEVIYEAPDDAWGDIAVRSIWAPELLAYRGNYYLFLTFDTGHLLPEQWRNWRPRVTRGSTILKSDSPTGPFTSFQSRSTPPTDMMTLDGTLYVEDGKPYMVFCHEWVQITVGTIEYVPLADDLSRAIGEPVRLFSADQAPWPHRGGEGGYVTDGPSFYRSKSGKLFMIWSSFAGGGYTTGLAISDSGKLAGPWRHQAEPLYTDDGGHGFLFTTLEGKLMMVLHSPNNQPGVTRPRIFELEDTGETLRIEKEFTGADPS
ncbi:glycoside hydrolase family 43 protein [Aeoliella sp. ICT_H6.2]|uniref:Glycoside hydrolase family 43 protein n=1 Tax=Aeoliella straminimaris TaxID=2954799 RepID=A0A9X2FD17_9BACT|nr:glycoside hydrolase family 43 protein [Aeoliella straminimaris]MCO6045978.1 glycoside hydrolase family 43 protein [Aeoliella straminimaris]